MGSLVFNKPSSSTVAKDMHLINVLCMAARVTASRVLADSAARKARLTEREIFRERERERERERDREREREGERKRD